MRLLKVISFFILLSMPMPSAWAQDTIKKVPKQEQKRKATKIKTISEAATDLETSLKKGDNIGIAKNYESLAETFIKKGDFKKAEEYLQKALLYTKSDQAEDQARLRRSIAKVQENQNKLGAASLNYKKAAEVTDDKVTEKLNSNDFSRLSNANSPQAQMDYNISNAALAKESDKKDEVADAYMQNAELNLKEKKPKAAIRNYEEAITFSKDRPEEVIKIKSKIAKVYTAENQFEKAIGIHQKLLADAQKNNDTDTEITQLQLLSSVYFKNNQAEKGVDLLKESYRIAKQSGHTAEAKKGLAKLLQYYRAKGDDKESMRLYEQFFEDFDALIRADTSLIDAKTFQVTEEKIRQLEKEKALKDELISKKNTFNYFLIGSVLLLFLLFIFIAKALYSIKIKNKEIALQSLRREMNPHFIFNSLNSVNQFISQNKELEANKYLSSYSHLMRNMMEHSNKDFVTVSSEIEQLTKYLDLEHLRFSDKFDYKIIVDDNIDADQTFIPNMILQPHLENAIWHGIRYRESKGLLTLSIALENKKIKITIEDNGIGLTKSAELKTKNQKAHHSRGITNTKERITLLNELYKKGITFSIAEKNHPETGTIVLIYFPIIHKI
ncbi:tetratricopeptide repeat-containing sensor histidine kinase [Flavobacterium pallidum]|uniref:Regulator of cell autolysis n=1 Tax=Flavobacterium pallidum TaxID=2172098 RepID=A0A2S1SLA8_9FLAO|nr:histidine kinase [Flavobacterium pallidum]AWI27193.1 regulator of cell autolysis [Flavobacterium pallidum]